MAYGLQSDAAYKLNDAHTVRAGFYVQTDRLTSNTNSDVLPTDANGNQSSEVPLGIVDDTENTQWIESVYLQDEWHRCPGSQLRTAL